MCVAGSCNIQKIRKGMFNCSYDSQFCNSRLFSLIWLVLVLCNSRRQFCWIVLGKSGIFGKTFVLWQVSCVRRFLWYEIHRFDLHIILMKKGRPFINVLHRKDDGVMFDWISQNPCRLFYFGFFAEESYKSSWIRLFVCSLLEVFYWE